MSNYFIREIHAKNASMMSMEKALNMYHLLTQVLLLGVEGAVVEAGTYRGLSAVLMQKTLDQHASMKELHVFDSFEGLPEKGEEDFVTSQENMRLCDYKDNRRVGKGWFASPEEELRSNFDLFAVKLPQIHKGWFAETMSQGLPEKICFAHIDGDFYSSTLDALKEIYPRMSQGGVLLIDDYCDPEIHPRQSALPGVKKACDEFFSDKGEQVEVLVGGNEYHGTVRKL